MKRPPGPAPVRTPLGLYRYFTDIRRDPIAFVTRRFEAHGDLYYAPLGKTQLYVTRHPEHVRQVLLEQGARFEKTTRGNAARQLARFLGQGLLNSNGDLWRRQRRMINPALQRKQIEGYATTMVGHTADMLRSWRAGETLDVGREMMQLTLRIVAQVLFDHDTRGQEDAVARAMTAFREMPGAAALLPPWVPLPAVRRTNAALATMNRLVYGMIDERRGADLEGRGDLLSALVRATDEAGGGMSREQLRDEVLTLFLAGHETTSHALSWTWYLLSQHPEAEARVHAELDAVLGGRAPMVADLPRLEYTAAAFDEAMRLYPPAPAISRTATEDVEVGGYTIPAGAELIVWIYCTHHDGRWFPEPERFRPERFLPGAPEPPKGAYLPFGAGTRVCIGKNFALMEAKLILATIAQRWRLRLAPDQRVERQLAITLSPKHGMRMVLDPRPPLEAAA